jgi:leucine-zipper of insertion element IS481
MDRLRREGEAGLEDRSSAPASVPSRTPADREQLIVALRGLRLTSPGSKVARQARRARRARVGQGHLAEQGDERERREQRWREEQETKLAEQRTKLAAGEPIRCECCFQPITTPEDAAEKHGSIVHKGDCAQQWGSAYDEADEEAEP